MGILIPSRQYLSARPDGEGSKKSNGLHYFSKRYCSDDDTGNAHACSVAQIIGPPLRGEPGVSTPVCMKSIYAVVAQLALSGCASLPPYQLNESELSQTAEIQNSLSLHDGRIFKAVLVAVDNHPVRMTRAWFFIFPILYPAGYRMKVAEGRRILAVRAIMLKNESPFLRDREFLDDCSLTIDADIERGKIYEVKADLAGPGEDFCVASLKEKTTTYEIKDSEISSAATIQNGSFEHDGWKIDAHIESIDNLPLKMTHSQMGFGVPDDSVKVSAGERKLMVTIYVFKNKKSMLYPLGVRYCKLPVEARLESGKTYEVKADVKKKSCVMWIQEKVLGTKITPELQMEYHL